MNTSPPSPANVPHRVRRRLLSGMLAILALVVMLTVLVFGALWTEPGSRAVWQLLIKVLPGTLSGEFTGGTLANGVQLRNLAYRDTSRQVKIDTLAASWNWSLAPLKLTVNYLRIGDLDITLFPTPPKPMALPRQITLPLAIDLHSTSLQHLVLRKDDGTTAVNDILIAANSNQVRHAFTLEHAHTPYGTAHASLQLDGMPPFAINGAASLDGAWRDERFRLDAQLSGSLQMLDLQLAAAGDRLNGSARLDAAPFAAIPVRQAQIRLHHLNPQLFNAAAPRADLDITAALAPTTDDAKSAQPLSQLTVRGPISLSNALPGPIDMGLLPVASAKADVMLDAQQQQLPHLLIRLHGGGTLEGDGGMRKEGKGHLALQARGLDPHAMHTRLKPSQLDGPLRLETTEDVQLIALKLAGPSFAITADTQISPQQITLKNARLEAGAARLSVSGSLTRDARRMFALDGKLTDFNPAQFFTTPRRSGPTGVGTIPEARINTDVEARGTLLPELSAQLLFNVHDSMYAGLPMTGAGNLRIAGKRLLGGDAQLSVAGNQLQLKGGFGTPPEHLKFNIDAPALARLGIGISGLLQADGELAGTMDRPSVDANYRAERLAYEQYRLEHLSGQIHTQGVPGRNPDARVTLELDARGAQSGDISLNTLNAAAHGSYASHTITLGANGQLRGQPLALTLAAQGRLQELPQGYAWDGSLDKIENRGFPHLSMAQPLTISLAPNRLELGPTRLTLEQAQIELNSLRFDNKLFSTAGAFNTLNVGHLLELQHQLTGNEIPLKTDLVLDGRWNLSLATSADGFFQIERRHGDIRVLNGVRESALGITAMQLRGDLQGKMVSLDMRATASRIGNANGQAQIVLQPSDGRLLPAPDAPLTGRIALEIPRLQSIAALAGPNIGLEGSAGIDLSAGGTLSAPLLSGNVSGKALALSLYDQGVRLHDGTAQIRLDNNIVELQQFELRGGEGTLRATGRIPLGHDSSGLSAAIIADHLQLLSKPSGQLTVSGHTDAANVNGQLQLSGKIRADHARFQLPEKGSPTLDDDVIVIRGKERNTGARREATAAAAEKTASPFTPRTNIDFDLGEDFRFEGSGADVLLGGTLAIESAPGEQTKANGTVRIVDGTYEAFGTKLTIEHGVLNFHNSFSNPDVNIVAMRRDREVAAGVNITGTVRQPRVQLVSEPDVPEEDKLSWLVFGRGSTNADAGSGQAQSAARDAALGLLNRFGGSRIAKGIGLNQLSIGSSEFGLGTQQVVSIGKEISNRLSVGYEQSLAGAGGVLKLTYDWTRNWSIVVRGGEIGGLDVLYNKRFDSDGAGRSTK